MAQPGAADELLGVVIDQDVDVVAVEVQLVEVEVAVLVLHVVYVVVHDVEQRGLGVVGEHPLADDEHEDEHEGYYKHHHERKVYCYPGFDSYESHASSLSTQPTPRTVWMSFFSKSASSLRRR